jgi:hypothetical protein
MKQWILRSVAAVLGCMFLFSLSAMAQGGELVRAEYGDGARRADVTQQVRAFIHDGVLRMDVTDGVLHVDPAYGHIKELFIAIRHWDGDVQEYRFPEHAHINLVLDPEGGYHFEGRELHIMRAFYGNNGHFNDVTQIIRESKQPDGKVFIRPVDNNSMHGDPDPTVHKVLRVLYWFEGQRRQVVVPEHGELHLP